jgi:hypothetical protein
MKTEHPEIADIKNICKVSPKTKITKNVCVKINKEKHGFTSHKKLHKKKS